MLPYQPRPGYMPLLSHTNEQMYLNIVLVDYIPFLFGMK